MHPVKISAAAQRDIDEVFDYYEGKRSGLGIEFVQRINEAVDRVTQNPQSYAVVFEDLRRCGLRKFPYNLFFKVLRDNSLIVACLHAHRAPELAKERGKDVAPLPRPDAN